ncbi:hypothetical protein SCAR479_13046 [Seiridium cardinale]|uniref:Uncharacterized protein n=1 Tax=Seiridium cardinale TaxID=138064 RepID=A0ABR2X994_9PEZI
MSNTSAPSTSRLQPNALAPIPSYSTYRQQTWNPTCTHLTMTRLYEPNFDREHMLVDAIAKGRPVNFDLLGLSLTEQVKPGPRSPEMRSNRYSFLKEIDAVAMSSYSPDQIATILEQRENLHHVLAMEDQSAAALKRTYYTPSSALATTISPPPGFSAPRSEKPWVPQDEAECQFKCCHICRPTCESRSYLSLDGILKDDIPPTAAVGFGFHLQGTRPVIDANIVKQIGYRAVPLPRPARRDYGTPASSPSMWSILDVIDEQIVEMARLEDETDTSDPLSELTHNSIVNNTSDNAQLNDSVVRPPWTPPATPSAWKHADRLEDGSVDFEDRYNVRNGRSPDSLKTNPIARRAAFESIRKNPLSSAPNGHIAGHDSSPYLPADAHDVGLFLRFNKAVFARACSTPLPPSTPREDAFFHENPTRMEEHEMEEGCFHEEPLEVAHGIAILEESVEMHVPDIMSQI